MSYRLSFSPLLTESLPITRYIFNIQVVVTQFRIAAQSICRTQTALGAFYRRIKARAGGPKAITATARKIACLFYRLLKYGQDYVEQGIEGYEQKYKDNLVKTLEKLAKQLGYTVMQDQNAG